MGQIRSRRGISTKISIKPEALYFQRRESPLAEGREDEGGGEREGAYRQRAPNKMRIEKWIRCAIPRAIQRSIHSTPNLGLRT